MSNSYEKFEATLASNPEQKLYWLNSELSKEDLNKLANEAGYLFYYLDGNAMTDHKSFFDVLTQSFKWPDYAASNWDAIYDVLREEMYYEPDRKALIIFDNCHHLLSGDPVTFLQLVTLFEDMAGEFKRYNQLPIVRDSGKPFQICIFIRGDEKVLEPLFNKKLASQLKIKISEGLHQVYSSFLEEKFVLQFRDTSYEQLDKFSISSFIEEDKSTI